jgi:hypothetical protein
MILVLLAWVNTLNSTHVNIILILKFARRRQSPLGVPWRRWSGLGVPTKENEFFYYFVLYLFLKVK